MADGGDGFEGRITVVQRTWGYRKWSEEENVRIVAEIPIRMASPSAEVSNRDSVAQIS